MPSSTCPAAKVFAANHAKFTSSTLFPAWCSCLTDVACCAPCSGQICCIFTYIIGTPALFEQAGVHCRTLVELAFTSKYAGKDKLRGKDVCGRLFLEPLVANLLPSK